MAYHPRIETKKYVNFITSRSRNSELWFINNQPLEHVILGYLAKYSKQYKVDLYAFAIEGNHTHQLSKFKKLNRGSYMRTLNSCIAKAVDRYTPEFPGGTFWGKRFSNEFVPGNDDIENQFFYTVLQPVNDGLVEKISDYPGYNCFHDAVYGLSRKFEVVNWGPYNAAARYNKNIKIQDYTDIVELTYKRLPGYEHLSQAEYAKIMHEKLEERRLEIVKQRHKKGLGFAGRLALLKTPRGARPRHTKKSDINSHRPRVLSICDKRRAECKKWYFNLYSKYKECSARFLNGRRNTKFPRGMYPPHLPCINST